jgi:hypothetical protein
MTSDSGGAWQPVFTSQTTLEELDAIIATQIEVTLIAVLVQLGTMNMTGPERLAALVLIEPSIRAQTAAALMSGWSRLQAEAGPVH